MSKNRLSWLSTGARCAPCNLQRVPQTFNQYRSGVTNQCCLLDKQNYLDYVRINPQNIAAPRGAGYTTNTYTQTMSESDSAVAYEGFVMLQAYLDGIDFLVRHQKDKGDAVEEMLVHSTCKLVRAARRLATLSG